MPLACKIEYRMQVVAEIAPFRGLLLGLAVSESLVPVEVVDLLVEVVAISMALIPLFAWLGVKYEEHMDGHETAPAEEPEPIISDMRSLLLLPNLAGLGNRSQQC